MYFFTGIKVIDVMLMIFYIALAIGTLSTLGDGDGPIQHDPPDR